MEVITSEIIFDLNQNINNQSKDEEDLSEKLYIETKWETENGIESMIKCKWLIIIPSCLFITLLSWEIVGDEEGWNKSYWVVLIGIGMMIILWLLDYLKLMNLFLK